MRDAAFSETDRIIELPQGEFKCFNSNNLLERSIYVRDEYIKLFEIIWGEVNQVDGIRKFLVTGAPGIGKSMFAYYFIWRYLHDAQYQTTADGSKRNIYFEINQDEVLYFTGNKTFAMKKPDTAKNVIKHDRHSIVFTDMKALQEPLEAGAVNIFLVSPNPIRYKYFLTEGKPMIFIMNPWSLRELKVVWQKLYRDKLSEDTVDNAFDLSGGVIRYVFEKPQLAEVRMTNALDKFAYNMQELSRLVGQSAALDSQVSYAILHPKSSDNTAMNAKLCLASNCVIRRVFALIAEEKLNKVYDFLSIADASSQSLAGILFEQNAHVAIGKNKLLLELRKLVPKATTKPKEGQARSRPLTKADSKTMKVIQITDGELGTFKNLSSLIGIRKGQYLRPSSLIQTSFDSFAVIDSDIYAFQVTVGRTHNVKGKGLAHLRKSISRIWPNEVFTYNLVFICPGDKQNTIHFKAQTIDFNSSDEYEKETAALFKNNQWIAEIQLDDSIQRLIKTLLKDPSSAISDLRDQSSEEQNEVSEE